MFGWLARIVRKIARRRSCQPGNATQGEHSRPASPAAPFVPLHVVKARRKARRFNPEAFKTLGSYKGALLKDLSGRDARGRKP